MSTRDSEKCGGTGSRIYGPPGRQYTLTCRGCADCAQPAESRVRRYTLDENYSELMEDGAQWIRGSDHVAEVAGLKAEIRAMREVLTRRGKSRTLHMLAIATLTAERDKLEASLTTARELLKNSDELLEQWEEILKAEGCKASAIDGPPLRTAIDTWLREQQR